MFGNDAVRPPKVTMRDIARQANVSPTTVSHVLNGTPNTQIAQPTRERVLSLAREMGYRQAKLARSIRSPLRQVGVAMPGDGLTYDVFLGVCEAAARLKYLPVVVPAPASAAWSDMDRAAGRLGELYASNLVAGFLLSRSGFSSGAILRLHDAGIPVVLLDGESIQGAAQAVPTVLGLSGRALGVAACELLIARAEVVTLEGSEQ